MKKIKSTTPTTDPKFALTRENYVLMLVGLIIIIIGFALMIGGKTPDDQFDAATLYGFQRTTLAPILVIGGFVFQIFAIFYRPKNKNQ